MSSSPFGQIFTLPLYPENEIPNHLPSPEGEKAEKLDGILQIRNICDPDITVVLPSERIATGEAVIICPGGGYWILAYDLEGTDIASYWVSKGVAAIVLKNRLPTSGNHIEPRKSPLLDAQRAIRLVRHYAKDWNIDPSKVGIQGFSAGGHLASSASTKFDAGDPQNEDPIEQQSCRPDFSILVYPVISFTQSFGHSGSKEALIGTDADHEMAKHYSSELHVNANTPPAILIHSADDEGVPYQNSVVYYEALQKHKVNSELVLYSYGGHGYGLATGQGRLSGWPDRCNEWLKSLS